WRQAAVKGRLADDEREAAQTERDRSRDAEGRERHARARAEANVAFGRLAQALLEWRQNNLAASQVLLAQIDPSRRGWGWDYLDALHHGELRGFTRPALVVVGGLALHPAGKRPAGRRAQPHPPHPRRTAP